MPTTMSRLCTSSRCLNTPVSISRMWKIFYIKIFLHIHHKLHHHKNIQWCIVEGIPSIFIKMCTWKIITPMKEKLKNFFLCMCVCVCGRGILRILWHHFIAQWCLFRIMWKAINVRETTMRKNYWEIQVFLFNKITAIVD